jgi:hypothetical protein
MLHGPLNVILMYSFYAVGKFIATFWRLSLSQERLLNCYLVSFRLYAWVSKRSSENFGVGQLYIQKSFI